ncbi:MAG: archaetidylserine decarboxylase [Myxococcaceae bacterium]|nr:archaetidylserine decarboxylase [Myxococcaceae bacterium]
MRDETFMTLMRLLPRSAVSTTVGRLTRVPVPSSVHQMAMRAFVRSYQVNMDEAEGGIENYPTFAQFFTRRLKPGARTIDADPNVVASPVDGTVSEVGEIHDGQCVQAKGVYFPVGELLGDHADARVFEGGQYATLYLAPRDYHRIHSPLEGKITGYRYLPGEFWPVNPASVRLKDALFAINERLVTWLDTAWGKVAVVAVGATCVSRIHMSYDAIVTHTGNPRKSRTYERPIAVEKGGELGMFEMGSTVILLFEPGRVKWDSSLVSGTKLLLGQRIGARL